jgi:predicted transglutaminase-like cysteine proteinase
MLSKSRAVFRAAIAAAMLTIPGVAAQAETPRAAYVSIGASTNAPFGWVEFCNDNPRECPNVTTEARDVVLTPKVWKDLVRINRWVNDNIQAQTDIDHWGVVERWSYPDDGKGDCEDYVLLKRRMLIKAGWPREALLVTVVRDKKGDGHAVLTVATDKGDFILDNQESEILLWSDTGYRFVKRQSQSNPNSWVALSAPRPAFATATSAPTH